MRLWSLHPQYLDTKGLLALWREGLLAQKVLHGKTKGYTKHPQLDRFKESADPVSAIATYLHIVCDEAVSRGYAFDRSRISVSRTESTLVVTHGQLLYEWSHLIGKLKARDAEVYKRLHKVKTPAPHPMFTIVPGPTASWEQV